MSRERGYLIMYLNKAKFKILKTPDIPVIDSDIIEFINYVPETEHLNQLGSGQYTIEEGGVFLSDEEDDLEDYFEVLDKYDQTNPFEVEKAHEELESKGYVKVGDAIVCNLLKRGTRSKEYSLVLDLGEDKMIVIAVSSCYKALQQYKKLIDTDTTRFKLGLILEAHPERVTSMSEYNKGILDEIQALEEELKSLNL